MQNAKCENFAQRLAEGALHGGLAAPDWLAMAQRRGCGANAIDFAAALASNLWGGESDEDARAICQRIVGAETALTADSARKLVAGVLGSPRAQLA